METRITRVQLAEQMVKKGYSKKQSSKFIKDLCDTIVDLVMDGHEVVLPGFGKYSIRYTRPRTVYLNNRVEELPRKTSIKFTPSSSLKRSLNETKN